MDMISNPVRSPRGPSVDSCLNALPAACAADASQARKEAEEAQANTSLYGWLLRYDALWPRQRAPVRCLVLPVGVILPRDHIASFNNAFMLLCMRSQAKQCGDVLVVGLIPDREIIPVKVSEATRALSQSSFSWRQGARKQRRIDEILS